MDSENPQLEYYLNATSKNDCFFIVGPESGTTERIGSFKLILMAHSEPFQKMLDSDNFEKGDIHVPDIDPKTFKDFLKCLYGGCDIVIGKLSFEECLKMLYVTEKYLVYNLKRKIISRIQRFSSLTLDNIFTILSNPVYLNTVGLYDAVKDGFLKNTRNIFDDTRFLSLDIVALMFLVQKESIGVPEIAVWKAILNWGMYQSNSDDRQLVREEINSLIEFIRFQSMDLKEFCTSVIPARVLTAEEVMELTICLANNSCHNIPGISKEIKSRYIPQEGKPEQGYLHYYVKNIKKLLRNGDAHYSEQADLGDYCWRIQIYKNNTFLSVNLNCKLSPKVKSAKLYIADVNFILVNQVKNDSKRASFRHKFVLEESFGYPEFINWSDVLNPKEGFIKDDNILLLAHVKLL